MESAESALYAAGFPTDEPNPNGEISRLLPYRDYLRRCMWDDPLYSVHASFASDYRTYKECWSDFDFGAFFTNHKMFFIVNSVKISLLNPFSS